jgi:deoxyhypusine monooxygenase
MVRHECAEALGAIGRPESVPVLKEFLSDPNPEVSESCEVALDLIAWVNSKDLHYAS